MQTKRIPPIPFSHTCNLVGLCHDDYMPQSIPIAHRPLPRIVQPSQLRRRRIGIAQLRGVVQTFQFRRQLRARLTGCPDIRLAPSIVLAHRLAVVGELRCAVVAPEVRDQDGPKEADNGDEPDGTDGDAGFGAGREWVGGAGVLVAGE